LIYLELILLILSKFICFFLFFFSSRRRHTRFSRDWSSDVCSSDLDWWRGARYCRGLPVEARHGDRGRCFAVLHPGRSRCTVPAEIGRASCRERVEILVLVERLKHRKQRI